MLERREALDEASSPAPQTHKNAPLPGNELSKPSMSTTWFTRRPVKEAHLLNLPAEQWINRSGCSRYSELEYEKPPPESRSKEQKLLGIPNTTHVGWIRWKGKERGGGRGALERTKETMQSQREL